MELLIDNRGKNPPFEKSGVPAISGMSVKPGRIDFSEARRVSEETWKKWMPEPTRRDDLILTSEAPLGRVAPIRDDSPVLIAQRVYCLRGQRGVLDSKFLYYAFQTDAVQADLSGRASGTTVLGIRQPELRKVVIPAPGYDEQRAIAEVLGALDDKIAANKRIFDLASNLAAVMFQSAIEESDAMTRSSIRTLSAEGVLTYGDGYRTKRAEHGQPGMQIVRAGDIRDGRVVLGGSDFVSSDYSGSVGPKICRPGDVVLTTKGTVGRVATIQNDIGPSVYSPQLCYFRMAKEQSRLQPWFAEWFRSADRIRQTDIAMHKSDMAPYVNLQDIGALQVPIPNDDLHCSIIEQLGSLHQLGHAMTRENRVLANTRDELLPFLMSGKLRVKDAEKKVEAIA
ncbi:restriction endonuclease subunit S [Nocardia miyunensis]|uniref:restriction endonuclease subunit S n=1 Tax=Nocardia miyunensis TaxID=282684 RepID=UPI001C3F717A|nr:restriction endonuclease subunit S [Nocardia miyunensis]